MVGRSWPLPARAVAFRLQPAATMGELTGRVALVTGAAAGIGAATARGLAAAGASVVLADRDADRAAEEASSIAAEHGPAIGRGVDVADPDAVDGLVAEVVDRFGRLDIAHNNAGVPGVTADTADYPRRVWQRVLDVDLSGVFYCMQAEITRMRTQGGGAIVNTASGAALRGVPGAAAYAAAKHGVAGLTKSAALEYAAEGIRINAVCPGLVRTGMIDFDTDGFERAHPIGRAAHPTEISAMVCWLAGDAASYVTGAVLPIDGGLTAGLARP
ncbi:SDR family NAD(P)-dependent oxidoreductase [Salinactinospora qingdaonensis]|uniref:SDR family oxidoreductase n=1 Tax=Salinactinospora qingdaonensis TaxID=702744 RepID=A0ABP7F5G9_9ACTN